VVKLRILKKLDLNRFQRNILIYIRKSKEMTDELNESTTNVISRIPEIILYIGSLQNDMGVLNYLGNFARNSLKIKSLHHFNSRFLTTHIFF
jgi:hypothetical protein